MTTTCFDYTICTFKILLSWRFPRKTAFWKCSFLPQGPPPKKKPKNFIFIVVSLSLIMDYVSQINSAENAFVYVVILVLPVVLF